ncbi:hypothetical protein AAC387_Pa01g1763 [Persea americana]
MQSSMRFCPRVLKKQFMENPPHRMLLSILLLSILNDKDLIIKKYGGSIQEVSSSNGSVNKEDSDLTLPPSDEGF